MGDVNNTDDSSLGNNNVTTAMLLKDATNGRARAGLHKLFIGNAVEDHYEHNKTLLPG